MSAENLRTQAKKRNNRGVEQKNYHIVNGVTYNVKVTKPGLFRSPKLVLERLDLKGRVAKQISVKGFSGSKIKHAILKDQWDNKKNLSMENQVQFYIAAHGHKVGSQSRVDLGVITKQCLETAKDSNKSINQRADALLGLCTAYAAPASANSPQIKKDINVVNFFFGLGYKKNPVQEIANGLFDAIKDPNLPKEEREKAGELLGKMYNNPEIPQNVKEAIKTRIDDGNGNGSLSMVDTGSLYWHLGLLKDEAAAQVVSENLFDAIKDPKLSEKERDKAGDLLAKMYNDPGIPQSVKDEIHNKAQTIVADLATIALRGRMGISEEAAKKIISEYGVVSGSSLQQQIIEPDPDDPEKKRNKITYRSYSSVEEQAAAMAAKSSTCDISSHTIEVDGKTLNFWIAKDKAGRSPSGLYLEDPKAVKGSDVGLREITNKFKNPDFSAQKEKLGELLSQADRNGFSDPESLKDALSIGKSFPFQELGFGPVNGGRVAGEAAGCLPGLKDLQGELQKTIKAIVQDPDGNTLSDAEKSKIVKAAKIATGKDMTFDEVVAQFKN
jgi:hypothetical protein